MGLQRVPVDSIEVGERQRSEMGREALEELRESIRSYGLLHPLVVRPLGNGRYKLICGHRRLEALRGLAGEEVRCAGELFHPPAEVPVLFVTSEGEEDFVLEFEENERREPLSWQDRTRALARLAELFGIRGGAEVLAEATGRTPNAARKDLYMAQKVARYLSDPKVAGASSLQGAHRAVQQLEAAAQATAIAAPFEVLHGDARQVLPHLRGPFHAVVWDPPYGVRADAFKSGQGDIPSPHHYRDDPEEARQLISEVLPLVTRLCTPGAHLWLFCDLRHLEWLRERLAAHGWAVRAAPVLWRKTGGRGGRRTPDPSRPIRRTYEAMLFAHLPGPARAFSILDDILEAPTVDNPLNKAEKPLELLQQLLAFSLGPGERLLDPMCGTGNALVAALLRGAEPVGVERELDLVKEAQRRLAEVRRDEV